MLSSLRKLKANFTHACLAMCVDYEQKIDENRRSLRSCHEIFARWWFQIFFMFTLLGEMIQFDLRIFVKGVAHPPTRFHIFQVSFTKMGSCLATKGFHHSWQFLPYLPYTFPISSHDFLPEAWDNCHSKLSSRNIAYVRLKSWKFNEFQWHMFVIFDNIFMIHVCCIVIPVGFKNCKDPIPIGSMDDIFAYIYHQNQLNVGKYTMDPMGF